MKMILMKEINTNKTFENIKILMKDVEYKIATKGLYNRETTDNITI